MRYNNILTCSLYQDISDSMTEASEGSEGISGYVETFDVACFKCKYGQI